MARVAAAIALVAALLLAWTPAAKAGCGGVETANPKHKIASRPPLAIGDSSMLLALPALSRVGYKVNARGCRQFTEGLNVMRKHTRGQRGARQAGIIEIEAPMDASNVMVVCPSCKKAIRVGYTFLPDGSKVHLHTGL